MGNYTYEIGKRTASFHFHRDPTENHDWKDRGDWSHYAVMNRLINFMRTRGWKIDTDKTVSKCIRRDFRCGRKGNLEVKAERFPAGFSFEFFQNINFVNPYGGYYDFDKFEKMPYLIRLEFRNELCHMVAFLHSILSDLTDVTPPEFVLAEDKIKYDYITSGWRDFHKTMAEFSLSDLDGQTTESYNNKDRDGKVIFNGQVKYFRDFSGHLARGKVYHNINNMWWVIVNREKIRNIADFELFDLTPEDLSWRRLAKDRAPEQYKSRRRELSTAKTKELVAELKRRGVMIFA